MSRRSYRKYSLEAKYRENLHFVQAILTHSAERQTVWLLFDSGAGYCGLVQMVAERLRLPAGGRLMIGSVHGDQEASTAQIDRVALTIRASQGESVDPIGASEITVAVLAPNWSPWLSKQGVSGLLGANFIKEFGFYIGANTLQIIVPMG